MTASQSHSLKTASRLRFEMFFPGISPWSSRFAVPGVSSALRMGYIILFVSADDLLHQVVPHHVLLSEVHYADPVDFAADFQRLYQPGFLSLRQVDLCDVPGDHCLGVEAQPRE